MDPTHLIEYTFYSKILSNPELFSFLQNSQLIFLVSLFFIIKNIPKSVYNSIEQYILSLYDNKDESSIIIPYHTKSYSIGSIKTIKIVYSERFLAINHYIKKYHTDVFSLSEHMNFENTRYFEDSKSDFILLPSHSQRIQICKEKDIYLEMVIEKDSQDEKSNEKKTDIKDFTKQYTFKITKKGKNNLSILTDFIQNCLTTFTNDREKEDIQKIFEYDGSKKDDDNESILLSYRESPFNTNKSFSNIFIENKEKIIEEIREFSKNISEEEKEKIKTKYKRRGIPYKKTFLLHGPPGCGKSSLIKSFLNETGRHCMSIPWSRIKTAADFSNICRVQYKKLSQKDVIIVFEDFDANNSTTVKIRENLKGDEEPTKNSQESIIKNTVETFMKISIPQQAIKEDELTLESVLNTLDGIHELHDSVIVFTTNDIISLDPALLRPGRIDKIIHMKLANSLIIRQILEHYYEITEHPALEELAKMKLELSPAFVQEICIEYPNDISACINRLSQKLVE